MSFMCCECKNKNSFRCLQCGIAKDGSREFFEQKPRTNYERICGMSVEELAVEFVNEQYAVTQLVILAVNKMLVKAEIIDEETLQEIKEKFEEEVKIWWADLVQEKLDWLKQEVSDG